MSRKSADRTPRLIQLETARRKIRKPMIVNLDDMAKIAGISNRQLHDLVKADLSLPVQRHGSTGVSYEFDASAVLDHLIAAERAVMDAAHAHATRVARISQSPIDPRVIAQQGLSVKDLRDIDTLVTSAQRKRIEQGEYVRRIEAEEVITALFTTVQSEILAATSRLDPAGRWPAGVRSDVQNAMRGALVDTHKTVERWLKPDVGPKARARGRVKQARRGRLLRERA